MQSDKNESRWGLNLLLGLMLAIAIAVLFVAPLFRTTAHPVGSECENNLSELYRAMQLYAAAFGKGRDFPPHTGNKFWFCLAGQCNDKEAHPESYFKKTPLYRNEDLFLCPSARSDMGDFDYIGPPKLTPEGDPSALKKGLPKNTPIAADKRGNHKDGGAVLYFSGRTEYLRGEEYEKVLKGLE